MENEPSTTKTYCQQVPGNIRLKIWQGAAKFTYQMPKNQHIVNIAIFVLTELIFYLIFYKFGLLELQALTQQALARHHPPAQRTVLLVVAAAAAPGSRQEQIYAKEKTTLIPPPPRGWGTDSGRVAPGEAGYAGEPA